MDSSQTIISNDQGQLPEEPSWKTWKKQLKISEIKNREKDMELEKLRAKLKAAGIEI